MRSIVVVAAVGLIFLTSATFGHGGEDHGASSPTLSLGVAPRAAAATEEFEVVAVPEGKHLLVYVDRFASNEPVEKAKVEVEGAGLKGIGVEATPGTYVMDLATNMPPGKHAFTISIEAGDITDLLSATLETSLPVVVEEPDRYWTKRIFWGVVALLALVSGIRLVARHNREKAKGI